MYIYRVIPKNKRRYFLFYEEKISQIYVLNCFVFKIGGVKVNVPDGSTNISSVLENRSQYIYIRRI